MTHEELIARAREHMKPFQDMEPRIAEPATFPDIRVRDTVTIYFSSPTRTDRLEVCLDRETGEFVGAQYAPPDSHDTTA